VAVWYNTAMIEEYFLLRHAAPDRAANIPYAIPPGPPLTERGLEEAVEAAAWLRGRGLEHVFASPFERTRQTANIVAKVLDVPLTWCEALREGAPGESFDAIRARVVELLPQLDDGPIRRVGLVTHGAVVKALLLHTTNDRIDLRGHVYDYGNHAPTAGIWHGVRGEGGWRWELAFRPAPVPGVRS
jgi:2,3-bisphosphoglycerate-dependent phosphoglycerate mutase